MIRRDFVLKSGHRTHGWLAATVGVLVTITAGVVPSAHAQQGDDAMQILKAMTDYVSSQKIISATYDTDIEVLTDKLQKIQFWKFRSNATELTGQGSCQPSGRLCQCRNGLRWQESQRARQELQEVRPSGCRGFGR